MDLAYDVHHGSAVNEHLLERCSALFSSHYGLWGTNPYRLRKGGHVVMSPTKLQTELLFDQDTCFLVTACTPDGLLVGHAFACRFNYAKEGTVSWVTQLVVHEAHRHRAVATQLCRRATRPASDFACGLVSSHPYAVRALEAASGRRTAGGLQAAPHGAALAAASGLPYVQGKALRLDAGTCAINTEFFVDHGAVDALVAASPGWTLGTLLDGEEYFAFCFAGPGRPADRDPASCL